MIHPPRRRYRLASIATTALCLLLILPAAAKPEAARLDTFESRAAHCLDAARAAPFTRLKLADDGGVTWSVPDPGKHAWNHVLAHLAADPSGATTVPGKHGLTARRLVRELFRFPNLFHFNADGPAACLMRFPQIVDAADRRFFFEGHARAVFGRTEELNYNLFTGEGTENHVVMSRFAGHLLCQDWLRDHPDDARAREGLALTKRYILEHARDVDRCGTGEWNSSTYYGYQLRGVLTCFEFAEDAEVRAACRALLDHFAAEMALKYVGGINAGPESRGGADAPVGSEMDQIAWLWWGDSPVAPAGATNAVYAALSTYRPPAPLAKIARKEVGVGATYFNSHGSYLFDRPAEARESIHFGDGYALSCAYLPYAGFTGACAQFRPAKLVVRAAGDSPAWVLSANGNGHTRSGGGRGPWEQWAHHRNVLVQLTHVPANAADLLAEARAITDQWQEDWARSFARRWIKGDRGAGRHVTFAAPPVTGVDSYVVFPSGATEIDVDPTHHIVFLRHGRTYVAIRSLKADLPQRDETYDTAAAKKAPKTWLIDRVGDGGTGGFVLEVATAAEHGSFDALRSAVVARTRLDRSKLSSDGEVAYTTLAGERLVVRLVREANAPLTEPTFDWCYIPDRSLDRPMPVMRMPPFVQPAYPRAGSPLAGWGRIPAGTVDGRPVGGETFLDPAKQWPVFAGPHINQAGGVLTITDGHDRYEVDFSGAAPRFSIEAAPSGGSR